MVQNSQKWESAGKTDPINSYFKHIAWMNSRKKGVISLTGYSKPFLGKEGHDKVRVLERELIRLIGNGYIFGKHKKYGDPTICMEIFVNGYMGAPDEKIVTLYPDRYELAAHQEWIENIRFIGFLKRLYGMIKQGSLDLSKLLHKGSFTNADDLFDITKHRFTKPQELYDFCDQCRREGHEPSQVYHFMLKYSQEKPFKTL